MFVIYRPSIFSRNIWTHLWNVSEMSRISLYSLEFVSRANRIWRIVINTVFGPNCSVIFLYMYFAAVLHSRFQRKTSKYRLLCITAVHSLRRWTKKYTVFSFHRISKKAAQIDMEMRTAASPYRHKKRQKTGNFYLFRFMCVWSASHMSFRWPMAFIVAAAAARLNRMAYWGCRFPANVRCRYCAGGAITSLFYSVVELLNCRDMANKDRRLSALGHWMSRTKRAIWQWQNPPSSFMA